MTRLRSFKHVFSTTSVREGLSVCLSVWAKTCFQRGRSFPFLETAGVVRSKHVNLLDSHRPIISASPDFKSRVCRPTHADARLRPSDHLRGAPRHREGHRVGFEGFWRRTSIHRTLRGRDDDVGARVTPRRRRISPSPGGGGSIGEGFSEGLGADGTDERAPPRGIAEDEGRRW